MAHLNFSDFHTVPGIKFDISRLRADLDKILKKRNLLHQKYQTLEQYQ